MEAVFAAFAAEAEAVAGRLPADFAQADALTAYQRAWFDLIWRYRCIYRDGIAMVEIAPALRGEVRTLRQRTQALARGVFEAAAEAGRLRIDPDALTRLLDNAWIVSSHWMSFRVQGKGGSRCGPTSNGGSIRCGALFLPYIVPPNATET